MILKLGLFGFELALFFTRQKADLFPYSFVNIEFTFNSILLKLALFCIIKGEFVEYFRHLSNFLWPQVPRLIFDFYNVDLRFAFLSQRD